MNRIRLFFALVSLMIFAVACKQPPTPPQPSMTRAPSSGSGAGGSIDDGFGLVDPSLEIAPSSGLESRPGAFQDGNSERLEGILPSIYFDFDQAALRPQDRTLVQQAADYLLGNSDVILLIEGHCDWRGTTEYNMALGERRAASVREYLLSLGIDASRVEIVSMGDREATQSSDSFLLQEDRRADLIVVR